MSVKIVPHKGAQTAFLSSSADIAIYGGAAGGGKSWALLAEAARHVGNAKYGSVIFRRELTRITAEGGLWDESVDMYRELGANSRQAPRMEHQFPSGARVQFGHLEFEATKNAWAGSQIALLCFDQLEEFLESQFWFLLSRNRSVSGVKPYIRATANPVPPDDKTGGWLAKLISWWIDEDTGYPIQERSGVVRWFVRINEELHWGDSVEKLKKEHGDEIHCKSLTFIPARVEDNPTLMEIDPGYVGNLEALGTVDRERLRHGNWKIKPAAGLVFDRNNFKIVDAAPERAKEFAVRGWDKGGTAGGGDPSSGIKIGYCAGKFYVLDVVRGQWGWAEREMIIKNTADVDGKNITIWIEQEPGTGGKESAERTVAMLAGWPVFAERPTGPKLTRAKPLAAQSEAGSIVLVEGPWNEAFLSEFHNFTGGERDRDDQVDSAALAFNKLSAMISQFGGWYTGTAQLVAGDPPRVANSIDSLQGTYEGLFRTDPRQIN